MSSRLPARTRALDRVLDAQLNLTSTYYTALSEQQRTRLHARFFGSASNPANAEAATAADPARPSRLIPPTHPLRVRWDFFLAILICYNCLVVPVRLSFSESSSMSLLAIVDFVVDLVFLLDIVLNFYTGYDDGGFVVMDPAIARRKYLTTWFGFDLISSFPFDIIILTTSDSAISLYLRLPRLLRLLRLPRLFRYLYKYQDSFTINGSALRMLKLVFFILFFAHLNACLQFFAANLEHFPSAGWVMRSGLLDRSNFVQYTHALFKSLSHMLCIGYGLYPPYTVAELWITMLSMCIGASFYAALVGIMSTLIMNMDRSGALYEQMVEQWKVRAPPPPFHPRPARFLSPPDDRCLPPPPRPGVLPLPPRRPRVADAHSALLRKHVAHA